MGMSFIAITTGSSFQRRAGSRRICFLARDCATVSFHFPERQAFGTMRLTAIRSGVTFAFKNAAMSSGVMESNTSGNLKGS